MTRSQALRNLLRCVFGNITLSVEDGKSLKVSVCMQIAITP